MLAVRGRRHGWLEPEEELRARVSVNILPRLSTALCKASYEISESLPEMLAMWVVFILSSERLSSTVESRSVGS